MLELLIVIAIIGILSTIAVVNLSHGRAKAKDARRLADFDNFRTALNLYYELNGVYPCATVNETSGSRQDFSCTPAGTWQRSTGSTFLDGGSATNCIGSPADGLFGAGILGTDSPDDPINLTKDNNNGQGYFYTYSVSGDRQYYILLARLEGGDKPATEDGGYCDNYYEIFNTISGKALYPWHKSEYQDGSPAQCQTSSGRPISPADCCGASPPPAC